MLCVSLTWLIVLKIISLFLAIWFTFVTITKWTRGLAISWKSFVLMALGITGFVVIQFKLYLP